MPGNLKVLCLKKQTQNGTSKHIFMYFCPVKRQSTLQRHQINKIYLIISLPLKELGPKFLKVLETQPAHTHSLHVSCIYKHIILPQIPMSFCMFHSQHIHVHPCSSFSHKHTGLDKRCIQVQSTDTNSGSILSAISSKNCAPRNLHSFCGMRQAQSSSHMLPGTIKGCHS